MKRTKFKSAEQTKEQRKKDLIASILDARELTIVAGGTEAWPCQCGVEEDEPGNC